MFDDREIHLYGFVDLDTEAEELKEQIVSMAKYGVFDVCCESKWHNTGVPGVLNEICEVIRPDDVVVFDSQKAFHCDKETLRAELICLRTMQINLVFIKEGVDTRHDDLETTLFKIFKPVDKFKLK